MPTQNKLFIFLIFCGSILLGGSCTKKLNTNSKDPNGLAVSQINGAGVFAQALLSTVTNKIGANVSTAVDNYDYVQQWMGYWARGTNWAASGSQEQMETFSFGNSFGDGIWQSLYHNILDYTYVIGNSTANSILPGASRVMRSMVFQDLVDQFGNIPYTQAVQAPQILTPAYDSAQAIYRDLVNQIDTAITTISASQSTSDDASDIMFHGNKSLWLEFANTIKLRLLLRQVPYGDQTYVSTQISSMVQQGNGFLGPGQDATIQPGFADATQKQNPFWAVYGFEPGGKSAYEDNSFFVCNVTILNFLDSINDPRIGYFFAENQGGDYGGNGFGQSSNYVDSVSYMGTGILQSPSMPALLFSASQSLFMQAEAAQRGLINGSYQTLYKEGVEESFRYLTVPSPQATADAYIAGSANGMVNINVSTNPLQTIMYQKWIAECELDGLEAWSDWRRTGFPYIAIPSYGAPGMATPQRLIYPESEYTQNLTNVMTQNQLNNANAQYLPVFWAY
jgi:SusD/RagB-like outer membrane lipoprotein